MEIKEYTIKSNSLEVKFLNLGAIITEINYKGKNRVLKFENYDAYRNNTMYLGAVVGRTAGRIKGGLYEKGQLEKNFINKHNLHGNDLNKVYYTVEQIENSAILKYTDPAADYVGNLNIEVEYEIVDNVLYQKIKGISDRPTLINMTNHTYFNLNGIDTILNHNLQINANKVGKLDEEMITTKFVDVANTAFDFRQQRKIKSSLKQGNPQFKISGFIDHPFKLEGNIALVGEDCKLEILTNQPYVVVYAGSQIETEANDLENDMNHKYAGICLETQKCPGDIELITSYESNTKYRFSTK